MVEGHRNANAVFVRVVTRLPNEPGVVEDGCVTQGRALREARGAGRVLNVDRVARLQRRRSLSQRFILHAGARGQEFVPIGSVEVDHLGEVWEVRTDFFDHRSVRRSEVLGACDEHAAAGVLECVFKLVRSVGGIDVDLNGTDFRGGVLDIDPLRVIRAPHTDTVALLDALCHEPFGYLIPPLRRTRSRFGESLGAARPVPRDRRIARQ